ncbi:MAG TPA: STAS domain-containing protein [Pseudonocardiaceae bacterium]
MSDDFRCEVRTEAARVVVSPAGELDLHTAGEFRQIVDDVVPAAREVALDLGGLGFVDSSGLSAFVCAHKLARRHGTRLVLVNVPPFLSRMLTVTGLGEVLTVASAGDDSDDRLGAPN